MFASREPPFEVIQKVMLPTMKHGCYRRTFVQGCGFGEATVWRGGNLPMNALFSFISES